MNRRYWLRLARGCMLGGLGGQAVAGSPQDPAKGETALSRTPEDELKAVREQLSKAEIGPLGTARSAHFQAIGDASEWFMSVLLRDCEQITSEYLRHFRARGFQLRMAESPLIVIVFRNDQSFDKFFHMPSRRKAAKGDLYCHLLGGSKPSPLGEGF